MQDRLTHTVIGAAIEVHRTLGPGLLESAYQKCLFHELILRGLNVARQVMLPVSYKGLDLDYTYRIDLLVDDRLVIEIKALDQVHPVHKAQLLSYLRLGNYPIGLLLNFHTEVLKNGIIRMVN